MGNIKRRKFLKKTAAASAFSATTGLYPGIAAAEQGTDLASPKVFGVSSVSPPEFAKSASESARGSGGLGNNVY